MNSFNKINKTNKKILKKKMTIKRKNPTNLYCENVVLKLNISTNNANFIL